ncbi:MAG: acyl-CoA synthetase [Sulfuricaulis sp.]|uniref:acyl-CoA synthetase n=1 Tax=Sulfuricaulis sp. TaxID=2003553 RepID=UPI0034A2D2E3
MTGWTVRPGYRVYSPRVSMFAEVVDRHVAEGRGEAPAVVWEGGRWSFRDLQAEAGIVAAGLRGLGVAKGDRVVVRSRNSPQSVATMLAVLKLGAVPVLTNSLLAESEIEYVLENSQARIACVPESLAEPVRSLLAKGWLERVVILDGRPQGTRESAYADIRNPDGATLPTEDTDAMDPAFMLYSSGTTGKPKGIVHAQRWVVTVGDPSVLQMTFAPGDIVGTTGEYSFMGNFGHALIFPLYAGSAIAVFGGRVTPDAVLAFYASSKPTIFVSVPTFYRTMLAAEEFPRKLKGMGFRFMVSTGEPLGAAVWSRWQEETGITLYEIYGVSEFEVLLSNGPDLKVKPGSLGKPAPDVKVGLLDDSLDEVPPGEQGVLMIDRSDPGLFLGYYRESDRWRAQHRGQWYYTGDVMRRDEDGYYWYLGRKDDLFKSRGYLISPQEVENVLQRHPAVAEVAVIGEPEDRIGYAIVAFAVLRSGFKASVALEEEMVEFVRKNTAPYKVPQTIRFIAEMPKNPVGKILRRALRNHGKP